MKTPRITRCCDGRFHRVIYGVGPYIADYPEQVLLACIVQGWCPKYVFFSWLLALITYATHPPFNSGALPHNTTSRECSKALVHTFTLRL